MALVSDVAPLLSKERASEPGGLWATKQYGDLKVCGGILMLFSCSLWDRSPLGRRTSDVVQNAILGVSCVRTR